MTTAPIARAVAALRAGELVAFPTETVYGLGADAASSLAVQRLYAVKGRPAAHPVIVHVASIDQLDDIARDVAPWARSLADACWPGPLTLVVARRAGAICDEVTGGRDTVAVRVPAHPVALELLAAFGSGVAAPSANRFGRVSPTMAAHVLADLGGDVAMVLDGGPCAVGVESTIVDATGAVPRILRDGAVGAAEIAAVSAMVVERVSDGSVAAPGTLASHYAPRARVELAGTVDAALARATLLAANGQRVGLLALAGDDTGTEAQTEGGEGGDGVVVLASPLDQGEYARVLYARLREADEHRVDVLVVVPPPERGVGVAVADRLRRAATVVDDA